MNSKDCPDLETIRRTFAPILRVSRKDRRRMSKGLFKIFSRKHSKPDAEAYATALTRVHPTQLPAKEAVRRLRWLGVKIGFSTLYNIASNKVNLDAASCVQIFFEKTGRWEYSADGISAVASMKIFKTQTGISYSVRRLKEKSSQTF